MCKVLTLFPLPDYLDDQHGEFLESWMAYLDFAEFPNLVKYYSTIGNSTLLKEEYTTMENCTLLKGIVTCFYNKECTNG